MRFAFEPAFVTQRKRISAIFAVLLLLFFASVGCAQTDSETDPVKLFNQGQDAHEKGDFQSAIKFYDAALKANAQFPEAEYQRGAAYASLGDLAEAEKSLRRAFELRGDWSLAASALGAILLRENNFAEAEKFLTRAVELDPKNADAFASLAALYLKTKPAPDVLKNFLAKLENLTTQANAPASVWAARGAIEMALQEKGAARKSFANALEINPNDDFALRESAELFLAEGDAAQARLTAEKLVRVFPNSANAKILLARAYAKSGDAADALKILDSLDAANPDVAALRNSLVVNNSEDAAALEKRLEREPKNADVLSRLCILERTANPLKALDYCRRAAEIEPNNLNHVTAYGAALVQAKQFDAAVALFRKILAVAPDDYAAHANLATALLESKRFAEAAAEYEWITKAKPDLAITYYLLGICEDQTEQYPQALENYRKFLTLADAKENHLEIDKVNLRLPSLERLIKQKTKR